MLHRTDALHAALRDVADHEVIYWPSTSAHGDGFAWRDGGDMNPDRQDALHALESCHLVNLIASCACGTDRRHDYASVVRLSCTGFEALAVWDAAMEQARGVAS